MMKPAVLNGRILEVPIIQGGMGVGISLSSLAGHVMKEGGMGVISAAHPAMPAQIPALTACMPIVRQSRKNAPKPERSAADAVCSEWTSW